MRRALQNLDGRPKHSAPTDSVEVLTAGAVKGEGPELDQILKSESQIFSNNPQLLKQIYLENLRT